MGRNYGSSGDRSGADVLFGAGGKTGNGALIETAGHDGMYCIGVESDQWETVPEAHPCWFPAL